MMKVRKKNGFTLVELSIVLIIIGLIIVAILRGQTLIENAKITRQIRDFQNISAAYYAYYDRYGFYPGDDSTASSRWPGEIDGNGNGLIESGEAPNVWNHLMRGGFVQGPRRGPYGGYLFGNMNFGDDFGIGNYVAATSIPGPVGERIDRKNDDGIYNQGLIQASASYAQDTVTLYWKL